MSLEIFVNGDERSVINDHLSVNSISLRVVPITGCPVVGKDAMEECWAWLNVRVLKAWASICDGSGKASRHTGFCWAACVRIFIHGVSSV